MSPALTTLLSARGDWGLSFLMTPGKKRKRTVFIITTNISIIINTT